MFLFTRVVGEVLTQNSNLRFHDDGHWCARVTGSIAYVASCVHIVVFYNDKYYMYHRILLITVIASNSKHM